VPRNRSSRTCWQDKFVSATNSDLFPNTPLQQSSAYYSSSNQPRPQQHLSNMVLWLTACQQHSLSTCVCLLLCCCCRATRAMTSTTRRRMRCVCCAALPLELQHHSTVPQPSRPCLALQLGHAPAMLGTKLSAQAAHACLSHVGGMVVVHNALPLLCTAASECCHSGLHAC
jgi:hypothetical protein